MNKIRVLIADDHAVVRMGLRVYLSAEGDIEVVGEARNGIEAGASGALLKSAENDTVVDAIRTVHAGKKVIPANVKRLIAEDPPVSDLSPRQLEILSSITRGLSNDDIAQQLGIGKASIKTHILSLFQKLGAANRAEAVAIALRKHLLKI